MFTSSELHRFLAGMEYPATRDDLLREAARDGLAADDRSMLAALPEQSFSAAWHIRAQLAGRALAGEFAAATPSALVTA
nr:DUF2795 domain-containing protein [uncultured Microbacterium sp.]